MGHNWVRYTSEKHIHPIDLRSRIKNPVSVSSYRWPFYNSPNCIKYLDEVFVRGLSTIGDKSWGTSPLHDWAFLRFTNFRRRKYSFSSPIPSLSVVPIFELPIGTNKHPNFEWRGQGRGADSFVLRSYPIWVQCLNNFVADCRYHSEGGLWKDNLEIDIWLLPVRNWEKLFLGKSLFPRSKKQILRHLRQTIRSTHVWT